MRKYEELRKRVEELKAQLSAASLEAAVRMLLSQGEDPGGGINAYRLVKHLLGAENLSDVETVWAYDRLKPVFRTLFEAVPSLYYFTGD